MRPLVLLACAGLLLFASAAAAAPREPVSSQGRWFVDGAGRVVIFHGVNIVPPSEGQYPVHEGVGDDDLRFLARQGFRLIRFGTFYADVEPQPGLYDRRHIGRLLRYQQAIAERGMFTLLDIHQDVYSKRFDGRGFPDWMTLDDGAPNQPNVGFPGNYFVNPATNRAYDNFWDDAAASDGTGIQTHFVRGWRRIAGLATRGSAPRLLGYDIFNEPWPGTVWPTCANPAGCPPGGFDQTKLTEFSRRAADSIRSADRRRIVFVEPNLQFDVGAATGLGGPGDGNAGLSFHDYCLGAAPGLPRIPDPANLCQVGEDLVMQNAADYSQRTGATPLLTEFGDTHDATVHERVTNAADERALSWTAWGYWAALGQIIEDPSKPPVKSNLDQGLLDALVRPYPYVVAGTPLSFSWDRDAGRFELRYRTRLPNGRRAPDRLATEVIAPRRCFPHGYHVRVRGAQVVSDAGASTVKLRSETGARRVRVKVSARGSPPT